jgi:molybdenum cofactor biosynthesis enzyme MoaA
LIAAVFANRAGHILDHPHLEMAGQSGSRVVKVAEEEVVALPEGSRLFFLPHRHALGWDDIHGRFETTRTAALGDRRLRGLGVSAFLPPGYTRTLLPGVAKAEEAQTLPLWSYTAVGWTQGGFVAAAVRTDPVDHSEIIHYDDREVVAHVKSRLRKAPRNRLLRQLARCATEYHCFAAKNLFLGRWEAPLPTSPSCNSNCLGCISLQPSDCCPASQERIQFVPSVEEVAEVAVGHLQVAEEGIVSFGQGCEGEPLMQMGLLESSIRRIRQETDRGTVHLNTNGSDPTAIEGLCRAGLDSIRISLNSTDPILYEAYFRPREYGLNQVVESIRRAKNRGIFVSLNLLVFPGVTDQRREVEGLMDLVRATQLDMIQMRNLSIDPDRYLRIISSQEEEGMGIRKMLRGLRKEFPLLEIGYFNRPKELFRACLCASLSF